MLTHGKVEKHAAGEGEDVKSIRERQRLYVFLTLDCIRPSDSPALYSRFFV
jgi:hypothetical protein